MLKIKPNSNSTRSNHQGMTLIELLVVISIIGVLAGLLLPALAGAKKKARETQARKDMADIKGAISVYQQDYNRLPASTPVTTAANDFTYGTTGTGYGTNIINSTAATYQANNSELMVILNGGSTNGMTLPIDPSVQNNMRNPRKTGYYSPKLATGSGATAGAGMGTDGVMRDPWSNPYIVALDLNYDGWVSNSVYNASAMNASGSALVRQGGAGSSTYALKDSVMIFSFGQDGFFDKTLAADAVPNKDNVVSWK